MSEEPRTVVIVRTANGHNQPFEGSDSPPDIWIRSLVNSIKVNADLGAPDRVPADVFVVDKHGLRALLTQGPNLLIVFTTKTAVKEARVIQNTHPRHRVVVCSGNFLPEDIPLIPKQVLTCEAVAQLVRSV